MNVMMSFIYGGTLDFPDKANVGYVLFFNYFKYKSINIFLASALLSYVSEYQWSRSFTFITCFAISCVYLGISKNNVTVFRRKNVLAIHSNKIKKSLY